MRRARPGGARSPEVGPANRALGRRVGICEAPELPHNAFIFVEALVVEDPDGPPTPRPPGEVPTLGPLGPCDPP